MRDYSSRLLFYKYKKMAKSQQLLSQVRSEAFEKDLNDFKSYRYERPNNDVIKVKIKYLQRHLRDEENESRGERGQILCYGYLGIGYVKQGNEVEAKKCFEKQLKMALQFKDAVHMQEMAYTNLGKQIKNDFTRYSIQLNHFRL